MLRVWSRLLVVVVTCLLMTGMAFAQDQPDTKKKRPTPEERKSGRGKALR